jgi:hypothetical protein
VGKAEIGLLICDVETDAHGSARQVSRVQPLETVSSSKQTLNLTSGQKEIYFMRQRIAGMKGWARSSKAWDSVPRSACACL